MSNFDFEKREEQVIKEMYFDEDCLVWARELDEMPFDKDGCHATGREICHLDKDPYNPMNWWNEYETEDGNYTYGR